MWTFSKIVTLARFSIFPKQVAFITCTVVAAIQIEAVLTADILSAFIHICVKYNAKKKQKPGFSMRKITCVYLVRDLECSRLM